MAHFAQIDGSNIVLRVVVVNNDVLGEDEEASGAEFCQSLFGGGTWKQTSYNGTIRKNFAGPGYSYDAGRDAFIPPQPDPAWVLDEETCQWVEPE